MRMTYKFLTYSPEQIRQTYNWEMYVFLLAIFVSLTNQVYMQPAVAAASTAVFSLFLV